MASVMAGLRCASWLPQRTAVKIPQTTAKPQPVAMTIHPLFSAFERFRSTPATTPLPSRMSTSVPMNSPKNCDLIRFYSPCSFHVFECKECSTLAERQSLQRVLICECFKLGHLVLDPVFSVMQFFSHDARRLQCHCVCGLGVEEERACSACERIFHGARHLLPRGPGYFCTDVGKIGVKRRAQFRVAGYDVADCVRI